MRAPLLALLLLAPMLAGCTGDEGDGARPTPTDDGSVSPRELPPVKWGGRVVDALSGAGIPDAMLRVDLSYVQDCRRQGLTWYSQPFAVDAEGAFGPGETPRPNSNDFAFFVHAIAPGYAENVTYVGPAEAAGAADLRIVLHPRASVEGTAPPGTVLALDAPAFPRFAVADREGRFAFPEARVVNATLLAATDTPQRFDVAAPANVTVPPAARLGWLLEGTLRLPTGAPRAADVVAWNGTQLWGAARAGDNGLFAMPLPSQPADLRLEARTSDGHHGATKVVPLAGPPSVRESIVMQALC